jgi:hypothetical protein
MRILLLHLSDLHFRSLQDPLMGKAERISSAVKDLEYDLSGLVLVISGDVAFSGAQPEYAAAQTFISNLTSRLQDSLGLQMPPEVLTVAGNHDCDLSHDCEGRAVLVSNVRSDPTRVTEDHVVSCCAAQGNYRLFCDAVHTRTPVAASPILDVYDVRFDTRVIRILAYNTAWMSERDEQPGSLSFPLNQAPVIHGEADLAIGVLHHPYNWFSPEASRALQRHVRGHADIVLVGHEHEHESSLVIERAGGISELYEGGVLQESDAPESGTFNAIVLDLGERRKRLHMFQWEKGLYQTSRESAWEPIYVNRGRAGRTTEPLPGLLAKLDEPSIGLMHPAREKVRLSDVFVYPDLREEQYVTDPDDAGAFVRGPDVPSIVDATSCMLLTGSEQSGKTALAHMFFMRFAQMGKLPVLLNGSEQRLRSKELFKRAVGTAITTQYGDDVAERVWQANKGRRILIVDDFHRLKLAAQDLSRFLDHALRFGDKLVLLADQMSQTVNEIRAGGLPDGHGQCRHLTILELGHVRRTELAERWLRLDPTQDIDEPRGALALENAKHTMDVVVGKNFVPAYPVFLLAILQAQTAATEVDLRASTHGYFYEIFIRHSLAGGLRQFEFDILVAYLTHVAYAFYTKGRAELGEDDLRAIHEHYETEYRLELPFDQLLRMLIDARVLLVANGIVSFRYSYTYYYFVASHLRDNIDSDAVREAIRAMCDDLASETQANVLLFLAHLTRNPFVLSTLQATMRTLFAQHGQATLLEDVSFLQRSGALVLPPVDLQSNSAEHRRMRMEMLDEVGDAGEDSEPKDDPDVEIEAQLRELRMGFRSLQIAGQILKNFPGSLKGDAKKSLTMDCYALGRRMLGWGLRELSEVKDALVEYTVARLKEEDPALSDARAIGAAEKSVIGLTFMMSYGFIRRIARATGAAQLKPTYEEVRQELDEPIVDLVTLAIKVEQFTGFPHRDATDLSVRVGGKVLPRAILQALVINHLYMFPIGFKEKQRICELMGISFKAMQRLEMKGKLLPKGS